MIEDEDEDVMGELFDGEDGQYYFSGEVDEDDLNEDDSFIDPPQLLSRKNTSHFSVVSEYYDINNSFLSSDKQYIGRTNTYNINNLQMHVSTEDFFNHSNNEVKLNGLQILEIFSYVEYRSKETVLLYVQYKLDFLNGEK